MYFFYCEIFEEETNNKICVICTQNIIVNPEDSIDSRPLTFLNAFLSKSNSASKNEKNKLKAILSSKYLLNTYKQENLHFHNIALAKFAKSSKSF